MNIGKLQDKFGQFSWSKKDSNYLDVNLKIFKKGDIKEFRLVQNLTMGEIDFSQSKRLTNQLVFAAKNIARKEKLSPVLIPALSRDMNEQLKLSHELVDIVYRANSKICETLLRYKVDKSESSNSRIRFFAWKKEDAKFQQIVYVNCKFEDFIYLLRVMNSVYDKFISNRPIL